MLPERLENRLFDVVVIGAGITGLGVALEFARSGFDVVVAEKDQLAGKVSNNSLRIIHGGLRYLQTGNVLQILDSIRDQARVIKESGSLVRSMPCVMPLSNQGLKSRFFVEKAAIIYNYFTERVTGQSNRSTIIDAAFLERHVPLLTKDRIRYGGLLWYDARVRDPQKLAGLLAHRIDREGGDLLLNTSVTRVEREKNIFVSSLLNGEQTRQVFSRLVVNTSGLPSPPILVKDISPPPFTSAWATGFNLVLNKKIQERFAVGIPSKTGRMFFVVPRRDVSVIGTGYVPVELHPEGQIPESILKSFLDDFNISTGQNLTLNDLASIDQGVIPVKKITNDGLQIKFHGRTLIEDRGGFFDVYATKYTTFYSTGQRVLQRSIRYLK